MFNVWSNLLLPEVELFLIHLPGRDKRINEQPARDLLPLAHTLATALHPYINKPFAFFGHSMGGLLAFETIRQMRHQQAPQPVHLFISARYPPHKADPYANLYRLSEPEFINRTENLFGAMPEIVRQDQEVLHLFLSIMRADFTMLGTYPYIHEPPLGFPISVFGGTRDKSVTEESLAAWREQTSAAFELQMFHGEHFFIQSSRAALVEQIKKSLSSISQ
jgi:surfactin synthase thioesterase subunit